MNINNDALNGRYPTLSTPIVLRKEFFGGIIFKHTLPQQMRLDRLRFAIACLCNGEHNVDDIVGLVKKEVDHSHDYLHLCIRTTLDRLHKYGFMDWKDSSCTNGVSTFNLKSALLTGNGTHILNAPVSVIFELTRQCNLRCVHCFSNSGQAESNELTLPQIKNLINQFAEQKVLFLNFSGGEPLIRKDLVEILHFASQKKIAFDISTNGTLVNQEFVDALRGTRLDQVQISIDGLQETHDKLRRCKGAFQKAVDAISLLRDAGYHIIIGTTINKSNLYEIEAIIDFAIEVKATTFKTTLFIPTGRGKCFQDDLYLNNQDVRRIAYQLLEKEKQVGNRIHIIKDGFYPWLIKPLKKPVPRWMRANNVGCAAGKETLFITANGDVIPCPFLGDYRIGNIIHTKLEEIWQAEKFDLFRSFGLGKLKGKCRTCENLGGACYGGCRAAAYAYHGDILGEDPLCWKT